MTNTYTHKPVDLNLLSKMLLLFFLFLVFSGLSQLSPSYAEVDTSTIFPRPLDSYSNPSSGGYLSTIKYRLESEPFNMVSGIIFFLAILHTMLTNTITRKANQIQERYERLVENGDKDKNSHSILASLLHLLGEVEVVFGFWSIFLAIAITFFYSWDTFVHYVDNLSFTEPLFVIVIMTIASSRPILKLFEIILWRITKIFGGTLESWWLTILIVSPILGAFITGPAAMAIAALLLSEKFYSLHPSTRLKYVTLALLFSNISIGGFLSNFASPPIMMVAGVWNWDMMYMLSTFGWKAVIILFINTFTYYFIVRKELKSMKSVYENYQFKKYIQHQFISQKELEESFTELEKLVDKNVHFSSELDAYSDILKENIKSLANEKLSKEDYEKYDIDHAIDEKFDDIASDEFKKSIPGLFPEKDTHDFIVDPHWDEREDKVPAWIMLTHVLFLVWTVANAHAPVLFLSGFLFYLGFYQVTEFYQNRLDLKPAILVAFFLSGIVIHGTLQGWWIAPLLSSLPDLELNIVSIILTSFNDNAAITYLSTLITDFPENLKYALVSGALTGGGLTVIANSPNPIGQSVLKKYFVSGISALQLLLYALLPASIAAFVFYILR